MAVKVGLVGTGTVGGGCLDILRNHKEEFKRHFGVEIELVRVCSRKSNVAEAYGLGDIFTTDFHDVVNDPEIDLVIVDLYPFEDTVASGACEADIIEKIDIGGISLIRAGAKNFKDEVIVPSKAEYGPLLDLLNRKGAQTDVEDRRWFATRAFGVSSHYDTAIHAYFENGK